MNFKHMNDNLEKDDLKIKAHLDASLDLSGIVLSERLISRTLEAIKNAQSNIADYTADGTADNTRDNISDNMAEPAGSFSVIDDRRRYSWPLFAKGIASVAAALLLLVVGVNAFRMMGTSKKDASSYDSESGAGMTAYDTGSDNTNGQLRSESSAQYSAASNETADGVKDDMSKTAGSLKAEQAPVAEEEAKGAEVDAGVAVSDDFKENSEILKSTTTRQDMTLTFFDICPVPIDAAKELSIIWAGSKKAMVLSNKAVIDEFYGLYESYEFVETDEMPGEAIYTADITGDGFACTVTIYKTGVTVINVLSKKETIQHSYSVINHEQFISELESMLDKYK
jgi:hypothetical protein